MSKRKKKKARFQNPSAQDFSNLNNALEALSERDNVSKNDYMEDIIYLLRSSPENLKNTYKATESMISAILPTNKIADEPEFHGITGDLFKCTYLFFNISESIGINWASFSQLPESIADSIRIQVLEEIIPEFFDDPLRFETLNCLDKYRHQKKKIGDKQSSAVASILHLVLTDDKNKPLWPKIGLLQGIVLKSLGLDTYVMDVFAVENFREVLNNYEKKDNDRKDSPLMTKETILEILYNFVFRMDNISQHKTYLARQIRTKIKDATDAVFQGRLTFGFFTIEELNKISEQIVKIFGLENQHQTGALNEFFSELSEKKQDEFLLAMNSFMDETFTPEKFEQMNRKLDGIIRNPGEFLPWMILILMIRKDFQTQTLLAEQKPFLMYSIFGELASFHGNTPGS